MIDEKYNVLLITMDCCGYQTIKQANIPYLASLGKIHCAEVYGTYTLPSHISTFAGYFPKIKQYDKDNDYFCRNGHQFWRLKSARAKSLDMVDVFLEGDTIVEGYKERGFYTLGVGGVRWFRSSLLTSYFDEFVYFGGEDYRDVFTSRKYGEFALDNIEDLIKRVQKHDKWFLFANCHETHVPYDDGIMQHSDAEWELLKRAKTLWGGKINNNDIHLLSLQEFGKLQNMQRKALESLDKKIGELFKQLPKPFAYVIMGDHGENFGEDGLYGHGFPHPNVIEVPLLYGKVE